LNHAQLAGFHKSIRQRLHRKIVSRKRSDKIDAGLARIDRCERFGAPVERYECRRDLGQILGEKRVTAPVVALRRTGGDTKAEALCPHRS